MIILLKYCIPNKTTKKRYYKKGTAFFAAYLTEGWINKA